MSTTWSPLITVISVSLLSPHRIHTDFRQESKCTALSRQFNLIVQCCGNCQCLPWILSSGSLYELINSPCAQQRAIKVTRNLGCGLSCSTAYSFSSNEVAVRRVRLVLGWVTVCVRVNRTISVTTYNGRGKRIPVIAELAENCSSEDNCWLFESLSLGMDFAFTSKLGIQRSCYRLCRSIGCNWI